jgi:flagella basal body P-ring formation protein FlgA
MNRPFTSLRARVLVPAAVVTALLVRAVAAAPAPVSASSEASVTVAPAVVAGTTARVAELWNVDPAALRLNWGRAPACASADGAKAVRVTGSGRDGWMAVVVAPPEGASVAVPVRAGRLDTVFTASRPLAAGARLTADDLHAAPTIIWGAPRGASPERPQPGWEVRRDLAAGDRLIGPAVEAPALVEPGESVQVVWSRGTVHVSLTGRAMNRARAGEEVRVRIAGRERPLTATAVDPGVVAIDPGGTR